VTRTGTSTVTRTVTRTVPLGVLGATVEVRLRGPRAELAAARLAALWHLCPADPAAPVAGTVEVDVGDAVDDLEDLLQVVTIRVTEAGVDAAAGSLLMLHAACLADARSGTAVAFVAPGGTGKTTLVRTLGPGRRYVTDETTAVAADGRVVPYPKPLSLRRSAHSELKTETAPGDLGLRAPDEPVRLGAVCLLDRREDHRGAPTSWSPGTLDAVAALVPHTSHLVDLDQPLRRLAALLEAGGGLRVLTYRDASSLEPVLAGLLREGS
jgi:hypothetical protein